MREYQKVTAACLHCEKSLVLRCDRDIGRKKFCSHACRHLFMRTKAGPAFPTFREARKCEKCGIDYIAKVKKQQYCSTRCASLVIGKRSRRRNNDLRSHLKRLLIYKGRKHLSLQSLIDLHESQQGKCALTGLAMTWETDSGRVATNVSIDRISSYAGYVEGNVQLVCRIANIMKNALPQSEFIELCRKIIETSDAKSDSPPT